MIKILVHDLHEELRTSQMECSYRTNGTMRALIGTYFHGEGQQSIQLWVFAHELDNLQGGILVCMLCNDLL